VAEPGACFYWGLGVSLGNGEDVSSLTVPRDRAWLSLGDCCAWRQLLVGITVVVGWFFFFFVLRSDGISGNV